MGDPMLSDMTILLQPTVVPCSHYFSKTAPCVNVYAQNMQVYVSPVCVCMCAVEKCWTGQDV